MFADREIVSLFPTMVFAATPALPLPALCAQARAKLIGSGPRRQTPPDLQSDSAFQPMVEALVDAARLALDELGYLASLEPEMTALWATAAPAERSEPLVRAGNAFFGGLLLGEGPAETRLRTSDPRPQARILEPAVSEVNALNAPDALLPLAPGQLLLFPGWLPHGLMPSPAGAERLVFRFSVLFRDFVEEVSPPNWDHPHGKRSGT